LWIEISQSVSQNQFHASRPVRALWIEILLSGHLVGYELVEAREGLVD